MLLGSERRHSAWPGSLAEPPVSAWRQVQGLALKEGAPMTVYIETVHVGLLPTTGRRHTRAHKGELP